MSRMRNLSLLVDHLSHSPMWKAWSHLKEVTAVTLWPWCPLLRTNKISELFKKLKWLRRSKKIEKPMRKWDKTRWQGRNRWLIRNLKRSSWKEESKLVSPKIKAESSKRSKLSFSRRMKYHRKWERSSKTPWISNYSLLICRRRKIETRKLWTHSWKSMLRSGSSFSGATLIKRIALKVDKTLMR